MELNNVRIGRACNSSSTHSILIKEKNQPTENWNGTGEFGWDQFTLTSPKAKDRYLSAMLHDALHGSFGESVARLIMAEMLHLDMPDNNDYVDHQSQIDFPRMFNSEQLDADYIAEFTKFIQRDDVILLGGNDNGGDHPLSGDSVRTTAYGSWGNTHCRRDDRTGLWTIFNRTSGSKVRIAFGEDPGEVKLGSPELVDVKVTDYCPYGCSYCYMGSTKQGEHADHGYLAHLVDVLAHFKVFEVAIGGGEPTLYPRILDFLNMVRSRGISAGLTTKNYHWAIENKDKADAIAFSVDSRAGLVSFLQAREAGVNAHAHIVDGVMPWVETLDIIITLIQERASITLLGMKRTGRGATFQRLYEPRKELVEIATENRFLVRVDTAFIEEYGAELVDLNVSEKSYTKNEGTSSCYVDAVNKTIGASSYTASPMHDLAEIDSWAPEATRAAFLEGWDKF